MTEGFAWGFSNNEGYYNDFDYKTGMSIDILVMGSSHMEALQFQTKYNATKILSKLSQKIAYNLGISGHNFLTCASNLRAAVQKYKPKFVLIETATVNFSEKSLREVLEGRRAKIPAYDKGVLSMLRRNNFFRLMYAQFFQNFFKTYIVGIQKSSPAVANDNGTMLTKLLNQMSSTVANAGAKLIIAYHPSVSLTKDGSLKIEGDPEAVRIFAEACKTNGIYFIDMSERFLREYNENYTLPYGFFNSSVGKGHMNKDGHRMFAEEIYKLMQRIEAD